MKYRFLISLTAILVLILSCSSSTKEIVYEVAEVSGEIVIDGQAKEDLWAQGKLLSAFTYPWQSVAPPKTTFKAIHDEEYLYFFYYAKDADIRLKRSGNDEMDAVASDRVEIFIRGEDESQPYYSFEMDPLGRVFDSKGEFGEYIDQEYDYPQDGLSFKGLIHNDHYTLEGKISLSSLRDLNLLSDDGVIWAGLYRGEYFIDNNEEEKTYWISWVVPDSKTPNFHIPSSFGELKLQ